MMRKMIFLTGHWEKTTKTCLEPICPLRFPQYLLIINNFKQKLKLFPLFKNYKKKVPEKKEQPLPESIEQDKNVSFANEDEDSEAGSSDSEEDEDDEEEAPIDDGKYKLEQQIDTEELVKELRERLHSINSPEDLIKVTQELDAKRGNCEADIMKRVFKNRDVVDENGKVIDDAKRVMYSYSFI